MKKIILKVIGAKKKREFITGDDWVPVYLKEVEKLKKEFPLKNIDVIIKEVKNESSISC